MQAKHIKLAYNSAFIDKNRAIMKKRDTIPAFRKRCLLEGPVMTKKTGRVLLSAAVYAGERKEREEMGVIRMIFSIFLKN